MSLGVCFCLCDRNLACSGSEGLPTCVCGSKKLGIHFIPTANDDNWMTPWHAVALETEAGSFMLVRRSAAEAMGARLVHKGGRPSHYTMVA